MKYFVSFVEEFWQGQLPKVMCRIEVREEPSESPYSIEEIHFCTDREDDYYKFREEWDWKTITKEELEKVRKVARSFKEEWLAQKEAKCKHKNTVAINEEGHAGIFCSDCGKKLEDEC